MYKGDSFLYVTYICNIQLLCYLFFMVLEYALGKFTGDFSPFHLANIRSSFIFFNSGGCKWRCCSHQKTQECAPMGVLAQVCWRPEW